MFCLEMKAVYLGSGGTTALVFAFHNVVNNVFL